MLGRAHEMALLDEALESAIAGQGRLVVVGGEAGIGKTRLAEAMATEARRRGCRVVWGRCWDAGGAPAYWPWSQIVRACLREIDPTKLAAVLGSGAGDLARIVPEVRDALPGLPLLARQTDADERFTIFEAMANFLGAVSAERPLALIFDDLHAADEPSLLLLRFVAAQTADHAVLILANFREDELVEADARTALLETLTRTPGSQRISPRALSAADVAAYLELTTSTAPTASLAEAIHRETEGNPLFITEVVRLLVQEGRLSEEGDGLGRPFGLTEGVRAVIHRRLARLSEQCRAFLARASVLGGEIALDLVSEVDEEPPAALVELLDEAATARILVEVPGSAVKWRFAHALVRDVLYESLPAAARRTLHLRVGQALERTHAGQALPPLAEMAHHYLAAGAGPKAAEYARLAAELAIELYAHEEAVRLYRLALEVQGLPDETRCQLEIGLGDALTRSGDAVHARVAFLAGARIAERAGLPEAFARAAVGYGGQFVWLRPGNDHEIVPLLTRALDRLGDRDDRLRVRLLARLSGTLRDEPSLERRAAISAEALELARKIGDPVVLGHALVARFWAVMGPDSLAEMSALADELAGIATETGDRELRVDARWLRFMIVRVTGTDRLTVHTELDAMHRAAVDLRQPHRWNEAVDRTTVALLEGRLSDAEGWLPHIRNAPDPFSYRNALFVLRREQDRLDEVVDTIRDAITDLPGYRLFACLAAFLEAWAGHDVAAQRALDDLAADGYAYLPRDWGWLFGMIYLAETAILLEDHARATEIEELLGPYAGMFGAASGESSGGPVNRALGLLAAFGERVDEGLARLADASTESARMGATLWETRIAVERAAILIQRGSTADRATAGELLRVALRTCRDLGLVALERQAGSLLETLQDRSQISAPQGRGPAAVPDQDGGANATFHREGDTWAIDFGSPFRLRDAKGLRYLAILLATPGREYHALDLVRLVEAPDAGATPTGRTVGSAVSDGGLNLEGGGNGIEILDSEAKAAYRERLRELSAELEEAEAYNDPGRAERARSEIDALERELAGAFGLGGRARQAISPAERARQSVSKAIRDVLRRIEAEDPELHGHLTRSIRTGTYCIYDPDPAATPLWAL